MTGLPQASVHGELDVAGPPGGTGNVWGLTEARSGMPGEACGCGFGLALRSVPVLDLSPKAKKIVGQRHGVFRASAS